VRELKRRSEYVEEECERELKRRRSEEVVSREEVM